MTASHQPNDGSDQPGNLITLCTRCQHPRQHKKGGKLWGWEPKIKAFRDWLMEQASGHYETCKEAKVA